MGEINKDTQLCISVSANPGNFGTFLHNAGYKALNLNFIYKSFGITDIKKALDGVRALKIRGCSVSMPFKESVIPYLDTLDNSAKDAGAVNTIVNNSGELIGYNTDVIGLIRSIEAENIDRTFSVLLLGCGGMARATLCALRELGFKNISIACRSSAKIEGLHNILNFNAPPWSIRNEVGADIIINATSLGMAPYEDTIPINLNAIQRSKVIIDAVASPMRTKLIESAVLAGKRTIPGYKISLEQLLAQFKLYTGLEAPREVLESSLLQILNSKT